MINSKTKQLKTRQICLFFIAFMPITKIFTMPSVLATTAQGDLWLCALVNICLDLLTLITLISVSKRTQQTYYQMLTNTFGEKITKIICFMYFIYFIFKSAFPIMEQNDYIDATLYVSMPSVFFFIPLFFVAFYLCTNKLRILGRLSDVLFVFTLSGYILLLSLSARNADYGAIFPIGVSGAKNIIKGSYHALTWFGDSVYFLFFLGNFKFDKFSGLKIIGSYLINGIMILLFLIVFYGIFTSIAFRQRFALTEISKYTTVINDTGRFDYVAIVSLLFSCIIAISIPLFFASHLLNRVFHFKYKYISPSITVALSTIITVALREYYFSIEQFLLNYANIFLLFFGNIFPLFFLFIKNKGGKNEVN